MRLVAQHELQSLEQCGPFAEEAATTHHLCAKNFVAGCVDRHHENMVSDVLPQFLVQLRLDAPHIMATALKRCAQSLDYVNCCLGDVGSTCAEDPLLAEGPRPD